MAAEVTADLLQQCQKIVADSIHYSDPVEAEVATLVGRCKNSKRKEYKFQGSNEVRHHFQGHEELPPTETTGTATLAEQSGAMVPAEASRKSTVFRSFWALGGWGRAGVDQKGRRQGRRAYKPSVTNRRPPARTRARGRRPDFLDKSRGGLYCRHLWSHEKSNKSFRVEIVEFTKTQIQNTHVFCGNKRRLFVQTFFLGLVPIQHFARPRTLLSSDFCFAWLGRLLLKKTTSFAVSLRVGLRVFVLHMRGGRWWKCGKVERGPLLAVKNISSCR